MAKKAVDKLIKRAQARALALGGVLAILLALRTTGLANVSFSRKLGRLTIDGKPIDLRVLRTQLQRLEDGLAKTIDLYTAKLQAGIWSIDTWVEEMRKLLEESHFLFAALAGGGLAAVLVPGSVPAEAVKKRVTIDNIYLKKFGKDIKARRAGTFTQIKRRAKSYLRSARITYQDVELQIHIAAGYTEAKRILTAQESCRQRGARYGCIEVAARGWVPIAEMPPIGVLVCGQYCRCYLIYR